MAKKHATNRRSSAAVTEAGARRATKRGTGERPAGDQRLRAYGDALETLAGDSNRVTLTLDDALIEITHLDKVLWPAIGNSPAYTRRAYMRYLLQVAPYMLPHLRHRPLTLIRQPDGVNGRRFVHFHYEQPLPEYVDTIAIYSEKVQKAERYLLCNNTATLVWLAHVGSLELHAWHSRANASPNEKRATTDYAGSLKSLTQSMLNFPDYVVCDLDPYIYSGQERAGAQPEFNSEAWQRCREVAFALKQTLDAMKLHSFVKTSGKTGLHVLIPIARTVPYAAARALAKTLATYLRQRHPDIISLDQRVAKRTGKIFFDHGMNARVKTLIAPYSVRGIAGAAVAMPLQWSELERASPLDYTMGNVADVLEERGDIWSDILTQRQDIERILGSA